MRQFTKDEILYRVCKILVKLFKNQIEEKRESVHSRIFNYILHPEDRYVYYGASRKVTSHTKNHPEHAVPCATLINECFRLIKENILQEEEIASLLKKHWKIVIITKDESKTLDFKLRLKSKMPTGWSFETGDTFERFKLANIDIVPEKDS